MNSQYFDHKYFNSYYYANIINNLIKNKWEFLGFVSQFFELNPIESLIKPWQKETILHSFIRHVISTTIEEESYEKSIDQLKYKKSRGEIELGDLYIEWMFKYYELDYFSFTDFCSKDINDITEDDFSEYYDELLICSEIERLHDIISNEVFYLVFNNRELLLNFNLIIAQYISEISISEFNEDHIENVKHVKREGQLKRVNIPQWVKKAVYFRDRGCCCFCKTDLSGILALSNKLEYDHIVPLSEGGANDITNIQLLCEKCNKSKSDTSVGTSTHYENWF